MHFRGLASSAFASHFVSAMLLLLGIPQSPLRPFIYYVNDNWLKPIKRQNQRQEIEGSEEEKHFSRPFDFLTSVLPLWQHKAIAFMAIALSSKHRLSLAKKRSCVA